MTTASQDLVVLAEKSVLPEAEGALSKLGAPVQGFPLEAPSKIPQSRIFICYFSADAAEPEVQSAVRVLKSRKNYEMLLFYAPHHSTNFAFELGLKVGHELGTGGASWAFDLRHVRQLLRSRNLLIHRGHLDIDEDSISFEITEVRKRLGLTQGQMAACLNVTTRTLQNWEKNVGTSQMIRKTRDLRELLELMDDYVVASEEKQWLETPLAAIRSRKPIDLIREGKLRDLIVEFHRMREGQPV
jgi:DNA-binding XRE family transcriptional regulator